MRKKPFIIFTDLFDRLLVQHRKRTETKKFNDKKRIEIYSKYPLTLEQKREIDEYYVKYYGKKIPYTWHQHYTAVSGKFDYKYFPELLFIPEFEHYMNLFPSYEQVFSDKNVLPLVAASAGIKTTYSFVTSSKGVLRDAENNVIDRKDADKILWDIGRVFVKPTVDTSSGMGCKICDINNGVDIISGKNLNKIIDELGWDFAFQRIIKCHKSIADLYSGSVNTFRIMTYRWKGKIEHIKPVMRIGQGGNYLDNAHAGGMIISVSECGVLGDTALTEFNNKYYIHPDSGVCFKGYKIELLPVVIEAAKKMHGMIPQIGVINWDFTIDEDGNPVLIEANTSGGSIWLFEMASGSGAFGEKTAEVLEWMRKMRSVRASERIKYAFGQIDD